MHTAIQVENLTRVFNRRGTAPFHALRGVSFDVSYGEIFGLLGPNGAGKTTAIKIMSTLLLPTSGRVTVAGFDVEKDYTHIRPLISLISGGETSGYGILTVEEQLWMFSQFYGMETPVARARIEEYLKVVSMWDSRRQQMNRLSTGMRQKVNLVRDWVREKPERSVILTTHYMAEADELCSRVAIINHGLILANAAPSQLKQDLDSRAHYEITVDRLDAHRLDLIIAFMGEGNDLTLGADKVTKSPMLVAHLVHESDIARLITALAGQGATLEYMRKLEPTLEDAFLKMVGRRFEDEEETSPVS